MTVLSKVFKKLKLKTFILTKKIVLINYYSWLQKKSERFGFERRKSTLKVRFLALWQICIFRIHHWRKSTTELTLSTYSILILPTYTFIHICVLSKNAKLDSFFSGKITFVSTTPPCGHGDESRHCRQASGQTVPQNLHTETWKCQVKYCIATHKTFNENWDTKAPSVGTLLAYLETTA